MENDNCEIMLSSVHKELVELKSLFSALSSSVPDMVWAKDLDGVYLYANTRLAYQLYNTDVVDVEGSTDLQLTANCKKAQGAVNFTFGEMCANSDEVVLAAQKSTRFVEKGLIKGRLVVLEVHKNVLRDPLGNTIGTVGIGRCVTDEYTKLSNLIETCTDKKSTEILKEILTKYDYPNTDICDGDGTCQKQQ